MGFDEQIMLLKSAEELKKMEATMVDRIEKCYYRCKTKHEVLYNKYFLPMISIAHQLCGECYIMNLPLKKTEKANIVAKKHEVMYFFVYLW